MPVFVASDHYGKNAQSHRNKVLTPYARTDPRRFPSLREALIAAPTATAAPVPKMAHPMVSNHGLVSAKSVADRIEPPTIEHRKAAATVFEPKDPAWSTSLAVIRNLGLSVGSKGVECAALAVLSASP